MKDLTLNRLHKKSDGRTWSKRLKQLPQAAPMLFVYLAKLFTILILDPLLKHEVLYALGTRNTLEKESKQKSNIFVLYLFECLFSRPTIRLLQSFQGQSFHGNIKHYTVVSFCSELLMMLSYYIHRANIKKFSTLAVIELGTSQTSVVWLNHSTKALTLWDIFKTSFKLFTYSKTVGSILMDLSHQKLSWTY